MSADWVFLTPEEMAAKSELIVVGRLAGRDRVSWPGAEQAMNVGVIAVESVLKGVKSRKVALVELPPARPHGLVASGDVLLADGVQGLWYLRQRSEGLYQVDRPDRFVPLDAAAERIAVLRSLR